MSRLSVIILTLNEERNIGKCLDSVNWADEVIVVDSGSNDKTVEVAESKGATVLTLEWEGYGGTKNRALEHVSGDWVLWLDADERVTAELGQEIAGIIRKNSSADAYDVARRAYFLGRWIRHAGWYPSRVVRLFRKGQMRFSESNVHEQVIVHGKTAGLEHDLLHFTDPNLEHYFNKFNRYTSLASADLHAAGRTAGVSDLLVRPLFAFFRMYIIRRGILDGVQGLILCVVSSAYVFVKYAKLWERNHGKADKG